MVNPDDIPRRPRVPTWAILGGAFCGTVIANMTSANVIEAGVFGFLSYCLIRAAYR
jgi:hypothetical protein